MLPGAGVSSRSVALTLAPRLLAGRDEVRWGWAPLRRSARHSSSPADPQRTSTVLWWRFGYLHHGAKWGALCSAWAPSGSAFPTSVVDVDRGPLPLTDCVLGLLELGLPTGDLECTGPSLRLARRQRRFAGVWPQLSLTAFLEPEMSWQLDEDQCPRPPRGMLLSGLQRYYLSPDTQYTPWMAMICCFNFFLKTTWVVCLLLYHCALFIKPLCAAKSCSTKLLNVEVWNQGSRPEWCISNMIYGGDTPIWLETLKMDLRVWYNERVRVLVICVYMFGAYVQRNRHSFLHILPQFKAHTWHSPYMCRQFTDLYLRRSSMSEHQQV